MYWILKEKVPFAVVQLLKQDSSYVVGATSDEAGSFKITAPNNGRFILKASYVGYKTIFQNITIANEQDVSVGQLDFQVDSRTLKYFFIKILIHIKPYHFRIVI